MRKLFYVVIPIIIAITYLLIFIPISNFPQPSGSYGVGMMKYHWIDNSRQEQNVSNTEHINRKLTVCVFYPSNKSNQKIPYNPNAVESSIKFLSNTTKLPRFFF